MANALKSSDGLIIRFGLTGVVNGALVHWSDMLAVRSGGRDQGLGTRLKLYQRDVVLGRGVRFRMGENRTAAEGIRHEDPGSRVAGDPSPPPGAVRDQ